jgi:hypothetical protein
MKIPALSRVLLDDFRNENPEDYLAGFPWHPHRGIETITYVLVGSVEHGDSLGNKGKMTAGDMRWVASCAPACFRCAAKVRASYASTDSASGGRRYAATASAIGRRNGSRSMYVSDRHSHSSDQNRRSHPHLRGQKDDHPNREHDGARSTRSKRANNPRPCP